jgi:hypothetical protein
MKYICTDEILNIRKKWYANKKPVIFEDLCSNISPSPRDLQESTI